jgi:cell division protein FtsZ
MGGGTGTGAASVVAELARAAGALTVAIVTKPFIFEGQPRMKVADEGLRDLREHVDTLIVIPNQRLLSIASAETTYVQALHLADEVLVNATTGISDIILRSGDINVDFADVRAVMANRGNALMGSGRASGPDRAVQAATAAISSPLLNDVSIDGAEALLVNITGGENMTLHEVADATSVIVNAAGEQAKVIFGTVVDPSMGDEVSITLIATGFGDQEKRVLPLTDSPADEAADASPSSSEVMESSEKASSERTNEAAEVLTRFAKAATAVGGEDTSADAPPRQELDVSWDEPEPPRREETKRGWGVLRDRPTFMKRQVE